MKEIGKTVLTIPVFTSKVSYGEVKAAMESISAKDVTTWLNNNIGKSLFAMRKQSFKLNITKSLVNEIPEKIKKSADF